MLTRRSMMQASLSSLLAAGYWPGALAAGDVASQNFRFVVCNDLHYLDRNCTPWFAKMIDKIKSLEPSLVLILGDLVEHGTNSQHGEIADILKTLPIPYHIVVGNHDYASDTDRRSFEQLHPKTINYTFDHAGWQFIGLDTTEGPKSRGVKIPDATIQWLDQELPKLDKHKPTVLFTHFPMMFGIPFILKDAKPILERLKPFNLQAVYSGHWHGYTELKSAKVVLTTGKCCSFRRENHDKSPEKGFFVCEVKDGAIKREFNRLN
jgi:predicted MPP superfamily phosphohydrolase